MYSQALNFADPLPVSLHPLLSFVADAALAAINTAVVSESADHTLQCLLSENIDLSDVDPANAACYHQGLLEKKRSKLGGRLTEQEIQDCIREMNATADMDRLGTPWLGVRGRPIGG